MLQSIKRKFKLSISIILMIICDVVFNTGLSYGQVDKSFYRYIDDYKAILISYYTPKDTYAVFDKLNDIMTDEFTKKIHNDIISKITLEEIIRKIQDKLDFNNNITIINVESLILEKDKL